MKPSSKDRMTVSIILVVFLLVLSAIGYGIFGKPKVAGGYISDIKIVKADNLQKIELYKKYNTPYAIKVRENNEFYVKYYDYENNVPNESRFDLTADQYNKLIEDSEYWFDVKYSKIGDTTEGIIKKIYTEKPDILK
jgi:hypothetical protein